jgi:hypothetical protein
MSFSDNPLQKEHAIKAPSLHQNPTTPNVLNFFPGLDV